MKDLFNRINVVPALAASVVHNSSTGLTIATAGYEAVDFAVLVGPTGDALNPGTLQYELDIQDSPDGVNWSPVAAQYVQYNPTSGTFANTGCFGIVSATNANPQVLEGGYFGIQPFVRLSVVVTGTMTTGTNISAVAVLGYARHNPAGQTQVP